MTENAIDRVEAKLAALLAIVVDAYVRQTGIARPKARSIDEILSAAGMSSADIAKLLGKTDRAVQLQLQAKKAKGKRAKR